MIEAINVVLFSVAWCLTVFLWMGIYHPNNFTEGLMLRIGNAGMNFMRKFGWRSPADRMLEELHRLNEPDN